MIKIAEILLGFILLVYVVIVWVFDVQGSHTVSVIQLIPPLFTLFAMLLLLVGERMRRRKLK